jgi:hypothetical protein
MTSSKSARRARRDARRKPEPRTEPLPALRTAVYDGMTEVPGRPAGYDATVITFGGMSAPGLPDADITAAQAPAQYAPDGRPAVSIGDALTHDDHWGPKLIPLPCGHCRTPTPVPADILERTNIIGHVNWLALRAGWIVDNDWIWTCPACQQDKEWKARQGQLAMRQPRGDAPAPGCGWHDDGLRGVPCTCPASYCDRHDRLPVPGVPMGEYRCTCPGAVLAVDVMLASEDYLGSGHGRRAAGRR